MVNAGVSSAGLDVVGADGGQVGEQAGEAVYRDAVLGAFARGFGERLVGALGRGDGAATTTHDGDAVGGESAAQWNMLRPDNATGRERPGLNIGLSQLLRALIRTFG